MNSSIVIFQIGSKSYNPKTKDYYNPWENHIWTCLEQARKWSPNTKIVVVLDDENVYGKENFEFRILRVCGSKWELGYEEIKEQISRDVLRRDDYYNGIINVRIGTPPKSLLNNT